MSTYEYVNSLDKKVKEALISYVKSKCPEKCDSTFSRGMHLAFETETKRFVCVCLSNDKSNYKAVSIEQFLSHTEDKEHMFEMFGNKIKVTREGFVCEGVTINRDDIMTIHSYFSEKPDVSFNLSS